MTRRATAFLVVGAVGLLLGLLLLGRGALSADSSLPVAVVASGRFLHRVEAEGVLVAEQATVLSAPFAADGPMRVAWLAADGSAVRAGEVVVRFDPTDMEKELLNGEVDRAKAEQQTEQKQLEQATTLDNLGRDARIAELQLEHAREFQTTDAEIFSRVEIIESAIDETLATRRQQHANQARELRQDLARVELDLLGLERHKAQLAIDKAEAGLREIEVRAPHDGIFVLRRDFGGEPSTIGQMAWPGMSIAEIPQLDRMKAQVFVLEADAGGLQPGVVASVVLEAHPGERIAATVRRIGAVPKRRHRWSPVQYFDVELDLASNDPERMKPGQRVRATLLLQDLQDVVAVPREAVFTDSEGESIVYRREGGRFGPVPVQLGAAALGRVVVEEGLSDGDVIALQDPTRAASSPADALPAAPSGIQPSAPRP